MNTVNHMVNFITDSGNTLIMCQATSESKITLEIETNIRPLWFFAGL